MHLMKKNLENERRIEKLQAELDCNARLAENTTAASTAAVTALNDDVKLHKAQVEELKKGAEVRIARLKEQFDEERKNRLSQRKQQQRKL